MKGVQTMAKKWIIYILFNSENNGASNVFTNVIYLSLKGKNFDYRVIFHYYTT